MTSIVPIPRCDVNVRPATLDDVPFIDLLQKQYAKQVGFLRASWIEGKIRAGQVLLAQDGAGPIGYVISQDKYNKREELGLVVQLCVAPGAQRKLIGATLLKAAFDRAAYGCRLFCCWCAQDIEANRFWESMGFAPLAYRAGSAKKARVHIFWQKRIREGDQTTPWWYPTETTGGAIGEGRIVLPIPPGKHWSDELPVLLPGAGAEQKQIADQEPKRQKARVAKAVVVAQRKPVNLHGGLFFARAPESAAAANVEKPKGEKRPKAKNDPKLVAAARELRDRWLEHVNETNLIGVGKYDVTRALPSAPVLANSPALLAA